MQNVVRKKHLLRVVNVVYGLDTHYHRCTNVSRNICEFCDEMDSWSFDTTTSHTSLQSISQLDIQVLITYVQYSDIYLQSTFLGTSRV